MSNKMKAYKVSISGSYYNSSKEIVDFQKVTGTIPFCDRELAEGMVRKRFAPMWLANDKRYPERAVRIREVYIDAIDELPEAEFSFIGKDILDMTYEELQDLATAKDLRAVPLYKKGGLRQAQTVAYAEYSNKVLGRDVDLKDGNFNVTKAPQIIATSLVEKNMQKGLTNEEIPAMEQKNRTTEKPQFSREELEKLAREKNIPFDPKITDEKLHAKIFQN